MLKLKHKTTGIKHIITGSIGVPREVSADVFEVWTNFSVDTDGDGQIETIEVPPTNPEWEVIDVPDPVVEPKPEPVVLPVAPAPTADELDRVAWLEQWRIYERANRAMKALAEAGFTPTTEETTRFNALKNWLGANRKPEYSQFM